MTGIKLGNINLKFTLFLSIFQDNLHRLLEGMNWIKLNIPDEDRRIKLNIRLFM